MPDQPEAATASDRAWHRLLVEGNKPDPACTSPLPLPARAATLQALSQPVRRHRRQAGRAVRVRTVAQESQPLRALL